MIYYDSRRWRTLLQVHGSVLPQAMLWALPSAIIAWFVQHSAMEGLFSTEGLDLLRVGDIYSGFTYVLGFSLVFRTSQAYSRYWTAATSIHEMASEWSDSCVSLVAFSAASPASHAEVQRFRHTVVRLFSLLHAMALSEVARIEDDLPLIDVGALSKEELSVLTHDDVQGRKVHIVLCWIKTYIIQMAGNGLLSVPAPILTRVFQELGAGLVKFHTAQQVVIWPFPFPYTQLNVILIQVYTFLTPLVICTWQTANPWACAIFTFISVTCMMGLDLIANELENPFGDDPNDLPIMELQRDMNKFLAIQLNPLVHHPPRLLPCAETNHKRLSMQSVKGQGRSLNQRLFRSNTPARKLLDSLVRRDRLRSRMDTPDQKELRRLQTWLKCFPSRGRSTDSLALSSEASEALGGCFSQGVGASQNLASQGLASWEVWEAKAWAHTSEVTSRALGPECRPVSFSPTTALDPPLKSDAPMPSTGERAGPVLQPKDVPKSNSNWHDFLAGFHRDMQDRFDKQLDLRRQELNAIQGMVFALGSRDGITLELDSGPVKPKAPSPEAWTL